MERNPTLFITCLTLSEISLDTMRSCAIRLVAYQMRTEKSANFCDSNTKTFEWKCFYRSNVHH